MATGSYWNTSNPMKPFGLLDPHEVKHIPLDFSEWLAAEGAGYESHSIDAEESLSVATVGVQVGIVTISVAVSGSASVSEGQKLRATVLLTASDGQKKSQTLWFKIKEL